MKSKEQRSKRQGIGDHFKIERAFRLHALRHVKPGTVAVFYVLLGHTDNKTSETRASKSRIMEETGYSKATVKRALIELGKIGVLETVRRGYADKASIRKLLIISEENIRSPVTESRVDKSSELVSPVSQSHVDKSSELVSPVSQAAKKGSSVNQIGITSETNRLTSEPLSTLLSTPGSSKIKKSSENADQETSRPPSASGCRSDRSCASNEAPSRPEPHMPISSIQGSGSNLDKTKASEEEKEPSCEEQQECSAAAKRKRRAERLRRELNLIAWDLNGFLSSDGAELEKELLRKLDDDKAAHLWGTQKRLEAEDQDELDQELDRRDKIRRERAEIQLGDLGLSERASARLIKEQPFRDVCLLVYFLREQRELNRVGRNKRKGFNPEHMIKAAAKKPEPGKRSGFEKQLYKIKERQGAIVDSFDERWNGLYWKKLPEELRETWNGLIDNLERELEPEFDPDNPGPWEDYQSAKQEVREAEREQWSPEEREERRKQWNKKQRERAERRGA